MRIIGKPLLDEFSESHDDAQTPLAAWCAEAEEADWKSPNEMKARYPSASLLGKGRVVFDIKGGNYRLLVRIEYQTQLIRIEKVGTHEEYDKWVF